MDMTNLLCISGKLAFVAKNCMLHSHDVYSFKSLSYCLYRTTDVELLGIALLCDAVLIQNYLRLVS